MDMIIEEKNGVIVAKIGGRLDVQSSPQAEKAILKTLEADSPKLVLNFANLEYISSAGLRVVLIALKEIKKKGGSLALCCLKNEVARIFEISNFSSIMTITNSLEEALEAVLRNL